MDIKYTGRNLQVDDQIKDYTQKRIDKLVRFLDEPVEIHMILEVEKRRRIAELHVSHKHGALQSTEEAEDMLDAIHAAIDKAEKQARRNHKKQVDKRRRAARLGDEDHHWPLEILEAESVGKGSEHRVIKTTRLPIKPKTVDEAALELDSSKNEFHVFLDSVTEKVTVIYRRNDGNYGLIAPEF